MNRRTLVVRLLAATAAIAMAASCTNDSTDSAAEDELDAETSTSDSVPESELPSDYLGSYTVINEEFGTAVTVTVDDTTRSIESNALPDHDTGEFPNEGNPNTISAQDRSWELPIEGVFVGGATEVREIGVAVNGVKFEPGTAETVSCSSGETVRVEALQELYDLGLDFNNAHVQPTGEYHYHGVAELLVDAYASEDDLVHIGFAADGFLIYYSKSGAYEPGYRLSEQTRTGTDCEYSIAQAGIASLDLEGTQPDGTYTSDWVYDGDNGDLDACNGATIDDQYVYLLTDAYPFIGRCLQGEVAADQAGGGPAGGGQAGGEPPSLAEAAEALGVSEEELQAALGGPPPDLEAAAETLGVPVEQLAELLPAPGP